MKRVLLYVFLMAIACCAGCSRGEQAHISVPPIDNETKGGAVVALDVKGVESTKIKDTHIYGFDAQQKMICHYYYPTPQELSLDILELNSGTFTFVAVLNVGSDFTPDASRATDAAIASAASTRASSAVLPLSDVPLSEFLSFLRQTAPTYPDMMTGMISRQINLGEVVRLEIVIQDKASGLASSQLQLTLTLPGNEFPDYQSYRTRATAGYALRGVVEAYLEGGDKPVFHQILPLVLNEGSYRLTAELPSGKYNLLVWADYAVAGTTADLFYDAASLQAVTFTDPYTAGTEVREVFYNTTSVAIATGLTTSHFLALERPLAKYRLLADDIARYRSLMSTNDYPPLEELSITVQYEGYLPCSFDVGTGKPNNSRVGCSYNAVLPAITAAMTKVEVANDYVFVNGSESSVRLTVLVKDKNGKTISRVQGVEVKYKRGMVTTVEGDFLTAGVVNPGINIDTNWDGEYEVTF